MDTNQTTERDIKTLKAAALRYDAESDRAPHVVAAGSGYVAQRILQTAIENGVAIYHDDSAATMLTRLHTGREIPQELYQIVVNIYLTLLDAADGKLNGKFREALVAAATADETEAAEAAEAVGTAEPAAPEEAELDEPDETT